MKFNCVTPKILKKACDNKWIEPFGCGGKGDIIPAINREPHPKTRLAVFADSDKKSPDAEIGDTQKEIKIECEKRKIPCHILEKRMIDSYIPAKVFQEIAQSATRIQKEKIEEWEKWTDEEKDFQDVKKHFKSNHGKSILPKALKEMELSTNYSQADIEERAGNELKQILDLLEKYL